MQFASLLSNDSPPKKLRWFEDCNPASISGLQPKPFQPETRHGLSVESRAPLIPFAVCGSVLLALPVSLPVISASSVLGFSSSRPCKKPRQSLVNRAVVQVRKLQSEVIAWCFVRHVRRSEKSIRTFVTNRSRSHL
ncbi:unnamed protein product [Durusdinium trenchii]|uniref:Uncharacterized protein n=1 Tax=Durusdinium trenchii TaxID=1381693 RepID=A0ABP0N1R9_9DINO